MAKFYEHSINLLIFFSIIISVAFYINFNRGIEFTDESYVLLISMYPNEILGRVNNSGIIGHFLLQIVDNNIYYFRLLGAGLLLSASMTLVNPISKFQSTILDLEGCKKRYLILIFILGTLSYYHNWVITPSYDLYNLIGILIFINGLIRFTFIVNFNWKILFPTLLVIFGGLISFICKPTTTVFLILIYMMWILYFFNLKKIFIICLISISLSLFIFYAYILIFSHDFEFYYNDIMLGIELKILLDPRYSILGNFLSTTKQILFYYYSNISYLLIFFVALFSFKILFKKTFDDFSFVLIFLPLFFTDSLLFTLLFIIFFYLLFDLHLTKIFKTDKKNITFLFYNFILIFILYAYVVGTNTNVIVLLERPSIILFLIIFTFILKFKDKKFFSFKKINLLFFILIIFVLKNLFDNFEKPRRYRAEIYKQKNEINLMNFNGKIYVDDYTFSFINEVQKIFEKNGWKKGNSLIDLTGRTPGLNIIVGARFVSDPWWGAGYVGTNAKVTKLLNNSKFEKIKKSWIATSDYSININPKLLNTIGLDINKDYVLVGNIRLKSFDESFIKNIQFWKPKYQ